MVLNVLIKIKTRKYAAPAVKGLKHESQNAENLMILSDPVPISRVGLDYDACS